MPSSAKKKTKIAANKTKKNGPSLSLLPSFNGQRLEWIVAALLLSGKLRVDSVQLFRQATMFISLTGKYKTLANQSNVENMIKFLNDNGNMTLDEMLQALKKKINP